MDVSPSVYPANRIRQERVRNNWRQQDLAEALGTTVGTVKRWERGSQQPSAYFRVKLCALFGKSAEELGLITVDTTSPPPDEQDASDIDQAHASPAEAPTIWHVPYPRNPHFTGREDLLDQLDQRLLAERTGGVMRQVALTQPQAIKGLGGIGKTQIAVEYTYRAREQNRYSHILWINAASEEAMMTGFAGLARLLPAFPAQEETNQRKLAVAIKRWLEDCQARWLLVFDNADNLSLIQPYLPQQGYGSVLLTTRANAVGSFAVPLEVDTMGLIEGTRFLLHRAQRLRATDEEINEATNVVIALDGFPLALDQAGAFIEETKCSFGDYLGLYQKYRQRLLARRGMQATGYPDSVATTWSLSFQTIEHANPAAAELLRLCAFLAPDHIPEDLLKDGAPYWPPLLQAAAADLLAFNLMIEDLLAFSLVKRLTEDHLLSLHRLVQAVQLDRMEVEEQHQWAERMVRAVNTAFPRNPKEDASWPRCLRYLEQVQACEPLIQKYGLVFPEAADVLERAGVYLYEHASYALAESLYQQALAIREHHPGSHHLETATVLHHLGLLYRRQGKYEQAEPLFQRALAIREHHLGLQHSETGGILSDFATLYAEQGSTSRPNPFSNGRSPFANNIWAHSM
ncbi:tetratricopeptide repeat protein [Dictyobacter kobayashii]|uniref:HTH cro/C1-type domain-containing protein n=1 Tax=Dictyobacter kobayashii TaxID=2014872 RepID=A0A402ASI5_9CHLR|nr:tetratricopeptide repeat protein [Dictyobacter kobayashii]GCE22065.1 hypothetical protein KDK_58650 [Dictyobacter kobayashii]